MKNRETFNFYRSFYEAGKEMNDKDRLAFYDAVLCSSFGEDMPILDGLVKIVYTAIKPVIDSQNTNYLNGKKGGRPPKNNPPLEKRNNPPLEKKESYKYKEKDNKKEKEKDNKKFSFTLNNQKLLSSTSKEYQDKLKDYINNSGKTMCYEDFYNQCEMKPYKYKNFKMAYDSWSKNDNINNNKQSPNVAKGFKYLTNAEVNTNQKKDVTFQEALTIFETEIRKGTDYDYIIGNCKSMMNWNLHKNFEDYTTKFKHKMLDKYGLKWQEGLKGDLDG